MTTKPALTPKQSALMAIDRAVKAIPDADAAAAVRKQLLRSVAHAVLFASLNAEAYALAWPPVASEMAAGHQEAAAAIAARMLEAMVATFAFLLSEVQGQAAEGKKMVDLTETSHG